jgi:hypothetical protein
VLNLNIESVKRKYEDQLMGLPNVNGIGIGERDGRDVLKVYVTQKVPEYQLKPDEIIPKVLDGYEVDVDDIGFVTAQKPKIVRREENEE